MGLKPSLAYEREYVKRRPSARPQACDQNIRVENHLRHRHSGSIYATNFDGNFYS